MPTEIEYLKSLMTIATGVTQGGNIVTKKNPALLNFLKTHNLVGTLRGSPVWSRSPEYYSRGRKTYPAGGVPGGARRAMERMR